MCEAGQIFAYEIKENSAIIRRCFSRDTKAEIPEYLEGYPVTEVAPYAFSAHMAAGEIENALARGALRLYVPELFQNRPQESGVQGDWSPRGQLPPPEEFPELCGDALEEIVFPASVRRVGRYCFYNCAHLHRISFYGELSDWGSGVFTGCHQVRMLRVYADPQGKSYLKDVLDELPETLQVEYCLMGALPKTQSDENPKAVLEMGERYSPEAALEVREKPGLAVAKLVFPEFYEEGVENTPARILETRVHGSGIRYRNCFNSRKFDFHQYDVLFPHARVQESPEIVGRLAMNRLRYPAELSGQAKARYEAYAVEHGRELADILLAERDMEGLQWLLELHRECVSAAGGNGDYGNAAGGIGGPDDSVGGACRFDDADPGNTDVTPEFRGKKTAELLDYMTEQASRLHLAEEMSFLMDYRRRYSPAPKKRKRLEL